MFLISLLLICLIAVTVITEQKPSIVEQEELIPIPIPTDKTEG
jgi:hypothetical protein